MVQLCMMDTAYQLYRWSRTGTGYIKVNSLGSVLQRTYELEEEFYTVRGSIVQNTIFLLLIGHISGSIYTASLYIDTGYQLHIIEYIDSGR